MLLHAKYCIFDCGHNEELPAGLTFLGNSRIEKKHHLKLSPLRECLRQVNSVQNKRNAAIGSRRSVEFFLYVWPLHCMKAVAGGNCPGGNCPDGT